jgi:hypothetical protein
MNPLVAEAVLEFGDDLRETTEAAVQWAWTTDLSWLKPPELAFRPSFLALLASAPVLILRTPAR